MSEANGQSVPPGWEKPALSEIASINPPLDRCPLSDDMTVTFVPMRAVETDGGGMTAPETRHFGQVKKGYTAFLSGDVITAKITPCMENGKTTVVPEVPEQHEIRRAAQRQMTGGVGQMRVPAAFFETVQIPLAPIAEQIRIIEALDELFSDLDAAVAALERVREKLKLYRASVLKAAVEGTLTAEWREQHPQTEPASELLKRILIERRRGWEEDQLAKFKAKGQEPPKNWKAKYKQPAAPDTMNLAPLPEGWCWVSFDHIGLIQGGLQKSPVRSPRRNHYPYLRVANVLRGSLDLADLHRFELTQEELSCLRLKSGDILIVEGNGSRTEVGRCALWRGEVDDCVHQNHLIRVRPLPGVLSKYADTFLNSPSGQMAIQHVASSTSGLYTLNISKIKALPLALPPSSEQEIIVEAVEDQVSVIDHLEADLDAKLKNAQRLRQSILRHAFTGQLVPQDPNDEPASELLKRIIAECEARAGETRTVKQRSKIPKRAHVSGTSRKMKKRKKS